MLLVPRVLQAPRLNLQAWLGLLPTSRGVSSFLLSPLRAVSCVHSSSRPHICFATCQDPVTFARSLRLPSCPLKSTSCSASQRSSLKCRSEHVPHVLWWLHSPQPSGPGSGAPSSGWAPGNQASFFLSSFFPPLLSKTKSQMTCHAQRHHPQLSIHAIFLPVPQTSTLLGLVLFWPCVSLRACPRCAFCELA